MFCYVLNISYKVILTHMILKLINLQAWPACSTAVTALASRCPVEGAGGGGASSSLGTHR